MPYLVILYCAFPCFHRAFNTPYYAFTMGNFYKISLCLCMQNCSIFYIFHCFSVTQGRSTITNPCIRQMGCCSNKGWATIGQWPFLFPQHLYPVMQYSFPWNDSPNFSHLHLTHFLQHWQTNSRINVYVMVKIWILANLKIYW